MRRAFFIVLAAVIIWTALAPVAYAIDWWPLVPCGINTQPTGVTFKDADGKIHDYTQPCNKCDLYLLFKNLIDFILFGVVPVGGTFLVVWAGFLILLGGANPSLQSKGKSILQNVFYAILLIAFSWLIVTSLLRTILRDENKAKPWWKITCTVTIPGATPTPTPGQVPGQAEAQALIDAIGIGAFSTDGDCGPEFTARTTIQAIAGGRFPPVCSKDCTPACIAGGTSGTVTVNPAILVGLKALKEAGFSFIVTSMTTGDHGGGSSHYTGNAVDIVPTGNRQTWQQVRSFLNGQGGAAMCENRATSKDVADCNAVQVNHIHWMK